METTLASHGYRPNGSTTASTANWANTAFTRVLNVPIKDLRREGTPEEVSPRFLGDVLQVLRRTYRRVEDPATGDVHYEYAPRGGIHVTTGADLAIAGFASLGHRARVLVADGLQALDGITPIGVTDVEALGITRGLIREELQILARELGDEPDAAHVGHLFVSLLGTDRNDPSAGHLGELAQQAGLDDASIVTNAHEHSLTSWQILRDHVISIAASWDVVIAAGQTAEHPLSRAMEAIGTVARSAEAVREALADEGLDEDSLDLIDIGTGGGGSGGAAPPTVPGKATLGRLLVEVERQAPFWRQLVEVGGRRGVLAIGPHASSLKDQLDQLLSVTRGKGGKGPRTTTSEILLAFREEDQFTPVWRAFALMREGLAEVEAIAGEIPDESGETAKMP